MKHTRNILWPLFWLMVSIHSHTYAHASTGSTDALRSYIPSEHTQARILGGTEVTPLTYPWMVSIQSARSGFHSCGGALIDASWVLTAAHCVTNSKDEKILPSAMRLVMNEHDLNTQSDKEIEHSVAKIVVHPRYDLANSNRFDNDIALLKLNRPETTITPVALAGVSPQTGAALKVMGWGVTEYKDDSSINANNKPADSSVLLAVDVKVIDGEQCKQNYSGVAAINSTVMLCAGSNVANKDACQGDSGGPLFQTQNGRPIQVGVVSFGEKCGVIKYPGVYTRVSAYKDWIEQVKKIPDDNTVDDGAGLNVPSSATFVLPASINQETKRVRLQATDSQGVKIERIISSGSGQPHFRLSNNRCLFSRLTKDESCLFDITYLPTDSQRRHKGNVHIDYIHKGEPKRQTIELFGQRAGSIDIGEWLSTGEWLARGDGVHVDCSKLSVKGDPQLRLNIKGPGTLSFTPFISASNAMKYRLDGGASVAMTDRQRVGIRIGEGEHRVDWVYQVSNVFSCRPSLEGLNEVVFSNNATIDGKGIFGGAWHGWWLLALIMMAVYQRQRRVRVRPF